MSLSTIHPFTTALMPMSQSVAWYLVVVAIQKQKKQEQDQDQEQRNRSLNGILDGDNLNEMNINTRNKDEPLYNALFPIASFYCLWALYDNIVQGEPDLGLYTMGIAAIGSFLKKRWLTLTGTVLVWLNFVIPSFFILVSWDAKTVAETLKHDTTHTGIVWAYILKLYFISNIILWSVSIYNLIKNNTNNMKKSYTPLPDEL